MVLSPPGNSARFSDGSLTDGEDIFMTIDNDSGSEFFAIEPPRTVLEKDGSQNERQISVDPISLQGSTIRQASFRLVSPARVGNGPNPSLPSKLKFVSASLPSSTSSSPRSGTSFTKKASQPLSNLSRMQSTMMDDTCLTAQESETRRSKSCGERRSSFATDDFELWLEKSNNKVKAGDNRHSRSASRNLSKPPLGPSIGAMEQMRKTKSREHYYPDQDGFKCGKLCLFLPRGKGKPVRSSSSASTQVSQVSQMTEGPAISRRVSLEKFEYGSWSSLELNEKEGDNSANLFFDLPLELLRCSVSDMQSPVSAAFVFDDDGGGDNDKDQKTIMDNQPRGVVTHASKPNRKSQDSTRHVRFSTSSPGSYPSSPTSVKHNQPKDDEFNAYLEAQSS